MRGRKCYPLIPVTLVTVGLSENRAHVLFLELTQVCVGALSVAGKGSENPCPACGGALGG